MEKKHKKVVLLIFVYGVLFLFFFPVALIIGTIHLFVHIKRTAKNSKASVKQEPIAKKEIANVQNSEPPIKKIKKKALQGPRYCAGFDIMRQIQRKRKEKKK